MPLLRRCIDYEGGVLVPTFEFFGQLDEGDRHATDMRLLKIRTIWLVR